ncbi:MULTISPECIES: hypothetical protein [Stenotrophomonas]|jgi:hypothetical protein|uniref:Lipoprotein n=3 Tax=Gammaproteobacteria TaxID=1236 RepID=A0ABU9JKT4_9GAMM|nr:MULTISPECIES: hypothetical protein [Stenotrophomonas]MCX2921470.1 hypothetical protein [Stenotrophomonas rhizophila]WIA60851.1 hypothetical protein POS15_16055 [Stenotrophomonas sp. BIO128-Bstrain]
MKGMVYTTMALLAAAGPAMAAGACDKAFKTVGDARNGALYMADVTVPGLKVQSALDQLRKIGGDDEFEVAGQLVQGDTGDQYLIQRKGLRTPLVLVGTADRTGRVTLATKLARGQSVEPAAAKQSMCGMLDKLKAGSQGDAVAAAGRTQYPMPAMEAVAAPDLSKMMGKEVKDTMALYRSAGAFKDLMLGTTTNKEDKGDRSATFLPLYAKYVGRRYQIDGQIYTVNPNTYSTKPGDIGSINYLVTPTRGLLRVRQSDSYNNNNYTIRCEFASDQAANFTMLRERDWAKLEGEISSIEESSMTLRNCRQAS